MKGSRVKDNTQRENQTLEYATKRSAKEVKSQSVLWTLEAFGFRVSRLNAEHNWAIRLNTGRVLNLRSIWQLHKSLLKTHLLYPAHTYMEFGQFHVSPCKTLHLFTEEINPIFGERYSFSRYWKDWRQVFKYLWQMILNIEFYTQTSCC